MILAFLHEINLSSPNADRTVQRLVWTRLVSTALFKTISSTEKATRLSQRYVRTALAVVGRPTRCVAVGIGRTQPNGPMM